ncbi:RNA methyltransferase [Paenibacillus filicis]|uniref:RNA methyltransferase n=1 Tax=Paenibacillus filicis TaxID=669464 RepID=A0ABU9DSK0_9BACL
MMDQETLYVYTYAFHEDEAELCGLEQRTWFGGVGSGTGGAAAWLESGLQIDPSRSPFMKQRLRVRFEAAGIEGIAKQAAHMHVDVASFKVVFVPADDGLDYDQRRAMERLVGACIRSRAEMRSPDVRFGIAKVSGRWVFGELEDQQAVWLQHKDKPKPYSTALSTRVARAIANIAVPHPEGVRAVDPCCGIGTVVIEALSMGIAMEAFDKNPLAVLGARENLRYFGYPNEVGIRDIRDLVGPYDAAVLDLPYNLCSKLSEADQLELLASARRLASRVVVVAIDPIGEQFSKAGLRPVDGCQIRKGSFCRYVTVCEA